MLKLKIFHIVPFLASNCISQTHHMPEHFWALICSDNWASNIVLSLRLHGSPAQRFPLRWKIDGKWDMTKQQYRIRRESFHPCSLMHDYSQSLSLLFIVFTHISKCSEGYSQKWWFNSPQGLSGTVLRGSVELLELCLHLWALLASVSFQPQTGFLHVVPR